MGFGQLNKVNRPPEPHASTAMQSAIYNCTSIKKDAVTSDLPECGLAHEPGESGIPRFGSSDYDGLSHHFYRHHDPYDEILAAFGHFIFLTGHQNYHLAGR